MSNKKTLPLREINTGYFKDNTLISDKSGNKKNWKDVLKENPNYEIYVDENNKPIFNLEELNKVEGTPNINPFLYMSNPNYLKASLGYRDYIKNSSSGMEILNAMSLGLLNRLSLSQNIGAIRDIYNFTKGDITSNQLAKSVVDGNTGFLNEESYNRDPITGEVINIAGDLFIPSILKNIKVPSINKASKNIPSQDQIFKRGNIVYGHPAIGKTYAIDNNRNNIDFIDWDVEFNKKRDLWIEKASGTKKGSSEFSNAKNEYLIYPQNHKDYLQFLTNEWNRVKAKTKNENKVLLASPHNLLRLFPEDFNYILTLRKNDFIKRNVGRGGTKVDSKEWKKAIDNSISSTKGIPIITLKNNKYLSDIINIIPKSNSSPKLIEPKLLQTDIPDKLTNPPESFFQNKYINSSSSMGNANIQYNPFAGEPSDKLKSTLDHIIQNTKDNPDILKGDDFVREFRNYYLSKDIDLSKYSDEDLRKVILNQYNELAKGQKGLLKGNVFWRGDTKYIDNFDWENNIATNTNNRGVYGEGIYFSEAPITYGRTYSWNSGLNRKEADLESSFLPYLLNDVDRVIYSPSKTLPDSYYTGNLSDKTLTNKVLTDWLTKNKNGVVVGPSTISLKPYNNSNELVLRRNTGIKSLYPDPETATGTSFKRDWNNPNINRILFPFLSYGSYEINNSFKKTEN